MPKYIVQKAVPSIDATVELFGAFVHGYLDCFLAFGVMVQDDNGELIPAGKVYGTDKASDELLLAAYQDCANFMFANLEILMSVAGPTVEMFTLHGHDFYLTRNRHGAGYWDRGYSYNEGNLLTDRAHTEGSQDAYYNPETDLVELM